MAPGPHSSPGSFSLTSCCQISANSLSKGLRISHRPGRTVSLEGLCDLGHMPSALWGQFAQRHMTESSQMVLEGLSNPGVAGCRDSKHLECPPHTHCHHPHTATTHTTTEPDGRRQAWAWGGRAPSAAPGASPHSIPASVLLYLTVATVSRKEERGGKVNFPPPTQIFLAGVVYTLPSQEGGVGRSTSIQVSLPRREDSYPAGGPGQAPCGPEPWNTHPALGLGVGVWGRVQDL